MRAHLLTLLRSRRGGAFAAALLLLSAEAICAQQLRGIVVDSASRSPIPGAVLLLLDATGATLGRNITNELGQYTIALSSGMQQVRVLRIGFRPRVARIPAVVGGIAHLDISMAAIPTLLQPVAVIDQPNCPRRADRPAAFALWEQTKAALLATIVAREANPANVLRLHFDRRVSTSDDRIEQLEVRRDSAATTRPFASARAAAEFVERGFVSDSAGSRFYHAPDAEVMLDDAFPRGYCFSLASDRSRPREVGLAFRAAREQRGRIDIDGVVWIDSMSQSLSEIVYLYRGLGTQIERLRPGGRIAFRAMDNGSVIIDRWFIRLVRPALEQLPTRIGVQWAVHEKGGEVARARWADGREWHASLGTLQGHAFYRAQPAANARLRLIDTDYEVVTDSVGMFKISHLLPGPYTIGVVDSILEPLDLTLRTGASFTAMRDSIFAVSLIVPTAQDYVVSACEAMRHQRAGTFSVVGRVVKADERPARLAEYDVHAFRPSGFVPLLNGRTNEQGIFVLCSVQRDDLLEVMARDATGAGTKLLTVLQRIEAIKVQLKPPR
jgi:hypothetical protein